MFLWCCLFKLPVFVPRDDDNLLERLKLLRATAEPGDIALNLSFTFKQLPRFVNDRLSAIHVLALICEPFNSI